MEQKNVNGVKNIVDRYAIELTSKHRSLAQFTKHSGEIGRAHEVFLREVLERFLPSRLRIGSGFIAGPDWTSTQQDVLIFSTFERPLLFEVGDCVVVDKDSVQASIEVKTTLTKDNLSDTLNKMEALRANRVSPPFLGVYAYQGMSIEKTCELLWEFVGENPGASLDHLPNAIHVGEKFTLIRNMSGQLNAPPFDFIRNEDTDASEGHLLLAFIVHAWQLGHCIQYPTWWQEMIAQDVLLLRHSIDWPLHLKPRVEEEHQRRLKEQTHQ